MPQLPSVCARANSSSHVYPNYTVFAAQSKMLEGKILNKIAADLAACLPELKIDDYFRVKPDILAASDHVIVAEDKGVIAVLAAKWFSSTSFDFLHIMTILVAQQYQGTLLFKRLWKALFADLLKGSPERRQFPQAFSLKTYNPISCALIQQVARKTRSEFYPSFGQAMPDWLHKSVQTIASTLEPHSQLDVASGVIKGGANSVPSDFYPQLPKSANATIMAHFASALTPDDRVLCCLFCREPASQQKILQAFEAIA